MTINVSLRRCILSFVEWLVTYVVCRVYLTTAHVLAVHVAQHTLHAKVHAKSELKYGN